MYAENRNVSRKMEQQIQSPEEFFLCVSNINSMTSEEKFSLYLENKAGGDADIVSVVYTEDRSTAVVQFNKFVDLTELQKKCKQKPLEHKYLEVCAIDPVKCLVVSAEEDITIEELKEYFKIRAQSGGGKVQRVSSRQDGCFTVKFKHEKDTLRAGKESCHVVSNISLTVTPLFFADCGDACNGIYDVSKHFVPLPSELIMEDEDVYIQTFLQQSNSLADHLNSQLKGKHAKVSFKEITRIECLLNKKTPNVCELVKTWETEVITSFRKYMNEMLHKAEIELTEDAWNEIECITTQQNHSSDTLITIHERNNLKIIFVGKKEEVKTLHDKMCIEHRKIKDKIQKMKQVITEELSHSIQNIILLRRSGIFETVRSISEDLKVEPDYQNGKIFLTGVKEDIIKAKLEIGKKQSEFRIWTISDLSKHQLELLENEAVKSLLDKLFNEKGLTVEMEFLKDGSIKVYTIESNQRNSANCIIMNMIKESKIYLDESSKNVISIKSWPIEIDALYLETKNKVKISIEGDAEILITATSDLHDYVQQRLKTFVRKYSIHQNFLHIDDEGIYNFLSKHCDSHLKETLEIYEEYFLTLDLEKNPVVLSGRTEGLSLAKADMDTLIKGIQHEKRTYNQLGITKILAKEQRLISEIEDSCRSVIMFTDSTSGKNTIVSRKNGSSREVVIWVYGDKQKDIQETFQEISRLIQSKVLKQDIMISQKLVPNITAKELDQFYHISQQCEVKLSIDHSKMKITVEGVLEEMDKAKDKIFELLRAVQEELFLNEMIKKLAETVQWNILIDDKTTFSEKKDFTVHEKMHLEKAYRKKEKNIKLENMVVDLASMTIFLINQPHKTANVIRHEMMKRGSITDFPINWVHVEFPETIRTVTLDKTSAEYREVEKKFLNSVKNGIYNTGKAPNCKVNPVGQFNKVKVHEIKRIQNTILYLQYAARRAFVARHFDGKTLEMDLWHGTPSSSINSINYYGFDRGYFGSKAGEPWYGRGIYFATDASYAARDWLSTPDSNKIKRMYRAKVVTGHYCAGMKGIKYLQERITGINYDSAVNSLINPTEFVIFNDAQAYPEYCIEFTI